MTITTEGHGRPWFEPYEVVTYRLGGRSAILLPTSVALRAERHLVTNPSPLPGVAFQKNIHTGGFDPDQIEANIIHWLQTGIWHLDVGIIEF